MLKKICSACNNKYAKHTVYSNKHGDEFFCCECYVKHGNPPADWHKECMETYNKLTKQNCDDLMEVKK